MSSYTFSDQKLALISVILTMGSKEDIGRVMTFALHLIKKRRDESARQQLLRLEREAS
jgi:cytochrome P450